MNYNENFTPEELEDIRNIMDDGFYKIKDDILKKAIQSDDRKILEYLEQEENKLDKESDNKKDNKEMDTKQKNSSQSSELLFTGKYVPIHRMLSKLNYCDTERSSSWMSSLLLPSSRLMPKKKYLENIIGKEIKHINRYYRYIQGYVIIEIKKELLEKRNQKHSKLTVFDVKNRCKRKLTNEEANLLKQIKFLRCEKSTGVCGISHQKITTYRFFVNVDQTSSFTPFNPLENNPNNLLLNIELFAGTVEEIHGSAEYLIDHCGIFKIDEYNTYIYTNEIDEKFKRNTEFEFHICKNRYSLWHYDDTVIKIKAMDYEIQNGDYRSILMRAIEVLIKRSENSREINSLTCIYLKIIAKHPSYINKAIEKIKEVHSNRPFM